MIVKRTSRTEILAKLRAKIERRVPVFIASAASGLVAQLLEAAGVDCVNTFSGARLRANGMGTMSMLWPILDSNRQTLDYTREDILPALQGDSFVCACLNANDPLKDMVLVLEDLKRMGVSSVSNIGPSISYVDKDSQIYKVLTSAGITLQNEIDMLKVAKEMGMVTIGLAFDEEDSCRVVAEAQPDVFCFHAGTTKGGRRGFDAGETIEETARRTEAVNQKLQASQARPHPRRARGRDGDAGGGPVHARSHDAATGSGPDRPPSGSRSRRPSRRPRRALPPCASRPRAERPSHAQGHRRPRHPRHQGPASPVRARAARGAGQPGPAGGSGSDGNAARRPGTCTRDEVARAGGTPLADLLQDPQPGGGPARHGARAPCGSSGTAWRPAPCTA